VECLTGKKLLVYLSKRPNYGGTAMKKMIVSVLVVLVGLVFAAGLMAQEKPAEEPAVASEKTMAAQKPPKTMKDRKKFYGEVISIDLAAKSIVAKNRKGEITFDVQSARIARNARLEEMKPGDKIGVVFFEREGRNMAAAVAKPAGRPKPEKKTVK
jgi:Cu/Ag efflux protein CusF